MKKVIKGGNGDYERLGIAKQVAGKVVDVERHPKFPQLWRFEAFGEKWIASDYAFEEK
jgi:hypothetical protein